MVYEGISDAGLPRSLPWPDKRVAFISLIDFLKFGEPGAYCLLSFRLLFFGPPSPLSSALLD